MNAIGGRLRRPGRLRDLGDESGMTLIELMVAMTAGMVVFGAITMMMTMTLRQTGRVTSHVEANQRARTTMTRIVKQLDSACFFPEVTPVRAGSKGDALRFWHQSGSAVAPTPVESEIKLVNGELVQVDTQPNPGGFGKTWTFPTTKGPEEEQLMKGIAPLEEAGPIFTYYTYTNGKISSSPLPVPVAGLAAEQAGKVVQVDIGFRSTPEPPAVGDENAATGIRDAVLLRLTPPAYVNSTSNPPCE